MNIPMMFLSLPSRLILLSCCGFFGLNGLAFAEQKRPNVVIILADDLGYGDLGCYGREDISTPVLDAMAAEGIRFTDAYANGSECTPTRAALLTGRYPNRIGGLECAIGTGDVGRYDEAEWLSDRSDLGLPATGNSLPQLLKEEGYTTCLSGKWHLGYQDKFSPLQHGFDESLECVGGGMDYFHYIDKANFYNLRRNGKFVRREGYFTNLVTNHACQFIEDHSESPFFLYVAYTAPHSPFQGPSDFTKAPLDADSPLWPQGKADPDTYVAMIEQLDRGIGRIRRTLADQQLTEETLVIFMSDNGGTNSARNTPLRGKKSETFEGGIRVPAIVVWPSRFKAHRDVTIPCMTIDFTRSILNAAGIPPENTGRLDGIDILNLVETKREPPDRGLFWRMQRKQRVWRAYRDRDWKYVSRTEPGERSEHLFNLADDVSEQVDRKGEFPQRLARMRSRQNEWEQQIRAGRRGAIAGSDNQRSQE